MAYVKETDVVLNFKMDGQVQYAQTVKEINKVMNTAASEYKNHLSAMDDDTTTTQKLATEKKKLQIQLEGAEKRTALLRAEYEASVKETGAYSKESEKLYKAMLDSETGQNKLKSALEKTNDELKKQAIFSDETREKLEKLNETGEKITGIGEGISSKVTVPILGIGAAGFAVANEMSNAQGQIQAALGLTIEEAEMLKDVAVAVWEDGWADSIDVAKESVQEVLTQLPQLYEEGPEAIQAITEKALILENTMDADMSETLRGTNALMKAFGMDGEEALDYITVATQNGLDKTDELGDNLAEYASLFEESGYSASDMFKILNAGISGGAYNLDKVNDLVKEFGVRVNDGTIEGAVENMSDSWKNLYAQWKQDGGSQKDLLNSIAKELGNVQNEQEKAAAVSQIFGSLGEDAGYKVVEALGQAVFESGNIKTAFDDVSGASAELKDNLEETVTMQSAFNHVKSALAEIGEVLAPYINQFAALVKQFADWFKGLDDGQKQMVVTVGLVIAAIGPLLIFVGKTASGISTLITVFKKMQLLFASNPFVLLIVAIAALIAGLVWAYNNVEWFRDGVNAFFQGVADVGVEVFNFLGGFVSGIFEGITTNIDNFVSAGKRIFNGFIDFITGIFTGDWSRAWQGVVDIFGGIFEGIGALIKAPFNFVIGQINGVLRGINNIKIPDWVPGIGGKSVSIGEIPLLAKGGHLINGQAIVGEAGPELLNVSNGKTTVTPLSDDEKRNGGSPKQVKIEQHNHFGKVDYNNPSERFKMDRDLQESAKQAIIDAGGIPG